MKQFRQNSLLTVFTLTYAAMVVRRSALEIWSLSKSQVGSDLSLSSTIFGVYDTSYLLSYALGEYINGYLCDRIGESIVVSLGLATASIGLILVIPTQMSILGFLNMGNMYVFCLLWIAQGYSHSAVIHK